MGGYYNNSGIARAKGTKVQLKSGGTTQDIINALLDTIPGVSRQTRGFSRQFTKDRAGLKNLWYWVRTEIHYNEDPLGVQWIREPARLWQDREGDCKSMTLFIVSVLENMGIQYKVRFSNTETPGGKQVNHVYPIAILPGGREVIVDAVYPAFDAEKSFYYAKDYNMAEIYRLSGIGQVNPEETAEQYLAKLELAVSDIPDDVLDNDITAMTAGQFARYQAAEKFDAQAATAQSEAARAKFSAAAAAVRSGSIAGIGAIAPIEAQKISKFLNVTAGQKGKAFKAPVLVLPDGIAGPDRIGSLKSALQNAWKKIVNWVFKTAMPLAAPFFLYSFLKKIFGARTSAKKAKQDKVLGWIQTAGKFDNKDAVMEAAKTGIIKKFGKTPQQLLNEAAAGQNVAGIGFVVAAIAKAIPFVIDIITKIVALFKKKDAPKPSESDAADLNELSEEAKLSVKAGTDVTKAGDGGGSSNFVPIAIAAGAALLLFSMNR